MRKYIKSAVVLAVLAIFIASFGSSSFASNIQFGKDIRPNCIFQFTAKQSQLFIDQTWQLDRWKRKIPIKKTIRAFHKRLRCASGPGHRKAIKKRWIKRRTLFYKHRRGKKQREREERERLRYLPFDCGGGMRSAIPCATMYCESGGSYTAANPTSSAYGKYQMLDSTYAAYCYACDWSPTDQDHAAYDLYQELGTGPWVCS